MRNFNAQDYTELIEESVNPTIQEYIQHEKEFLEQIPGIETRKLVDLGAGHGRTMLDIAAKTKHFVGIELNPQMYKGLAERAASISNTTAIQGDITQLNSIMSSIDSIDNPIFLIMQNSLGTIEGEWQKVIKELSIYGQNNSTELIISFLKADRLQYEGIALYQSLEPMVGEIDYVKSDLVHGFLVTKTGYTSKWWSDKDIEGIFRTLKATVLQPFETKTYCMYHIKINT